MTYVCAHVLEFPLPGRRAASAPRLRRCPGDLRDSWAAAALTRQSVARARPSLRPVGRRYKRRAMLSNDEPLDDD